MSYRAQLVVLMAVTACCMWGCRSTISASQGARDVEVLSQGYLHGERKDKCQEIDRFEVVVAENEVPGTKTQSVAQIKARNEAARRGATHVMLWPETDEPCTSKGELQQDGDEVCQVAPVTAYECIIGYSN